MDSETSPSPSSSCHLTRSSSLLTACLYPHGNFQNGVISKSLGHRRVWDRNAAEAACCTTGHGSFHHFLRSVDLRCRVSCHKSTSQPDLKEHCRVTITEEGGGGRRGGRRGGGRRSEQNEKQQPASSKDSDKRAFSLLPALRTCLINHLCAINHRDSAARRTRWLPMPLDLQDRQTDRLGRQTDRTWPGVEGVLKNHW